MIPPVAAENVKIRLLGVPEVSPDARVGVFPSRGYCLLALLALAPSRRMTRAQAAAQLWDDQESGANLANLRQLLLRMQRAFPGLDLIMGVDNGTLWLAEESSQIDLCRFL